MPAIWALEALVDAVKPLIEASFTVSTGVSPNVVTTKTVLVDYGKTRPAMSINVGPVGRVVFVPGGPDGEMGDIGGGKQWPYPDGVKGLLNLDETFCVYIYGKDATQNYQKDRAHDHVGRLVFHETVRQLRIVSMQHPAVTSPVKFGKPRWMKPESTTQLGREILLMCSIEQPILDLFDDQMLTEIVHPKMVLADSIGNYTGTSTTLPE
jgi:hypothetical protein